MNAVVTTNEKQLPEPVSRRGLNESQWMTLKNSLFPGADSNSVLLAVDYCKARGLDVMKKPCHIVPMKVKDAKSGDYVWRDVILPGIYEYRTTAARTGLYLGHSKPEYGPVVDFLGVKAPEWCDITVYRWNKEANMRGEYPVRVLFAECCGTSFDTKAQKLYVNARWTKAPIQMMSKVCEAAGLREAFPEDLGGTHTSDEMEGQYYEPIVVDVSPGKRVNPRPDLSQVDDNELLAAFSAAVDILGQDKEESHIGLDLLDFEDKYLRGKEDLYTALADKLAKDGIMNKSGWKKLISMGKEQQHKDF